MSLALDELEIDLLSKKYYVTIDGTKFVSTEFSKVTALLVEANLITKLKIIGYTSDKKLFTSLVKLASPKSCEIDLSNNLLGKDGITIAATLGASTQLTKVDLSNNALKKDGSKVLEALASESILDINIANNWMTSCDVKVLQKFESYTDFHHLDLSGNDFQGLVGVHSDVLELIV